MATYSGDGIDLPLEADIDLSASQYRFVTAASNGKVTGATTSGGSVLGILQNDPKAGEEAHVRVGGTSKLLCDSASAPSAGKFLKSGSDGQGLGYESLTASVFGPAIALESLTSGSGVKLEVFLLGGPGVRG